jgi:hypothetical protein
MNAHEPVCVALVLCDQVIEDRTTHNKSLIGTFNQIHVPRLPALHPRFSVVASVTDGIGDHPLQLQIIHGQPDGSEVVDFQVGAKLHLKDPHDTTDVVFNVVNFPLRTLGCYVVRVTLGERGAIHQRTFRVSQSTRKSEPPDVQGLQ